MSSDLYPSLTNLYGRHAVPFPSNFHWTSKVITPLPWENRDRPILASFIGSTSSYWKRARLLRMKLAKYCDRNYPSCIRMAYANHSGERTTYLDENSSDPHRILSYRSTFCFVPVGDMPTRKGLFDSMLHGCLPVTFDPLTAVSMYTWHWSEELWKRVAVQIPMSRDDETLSGDPVAYLKQLLLWNSSLIETKQKLLRRHVFSLQYALEDYRPNSSWPMHQNGRPLQDAYLVSMELVLGWHSGRLEHRLNLTVPECWHKGTVVKNRCVRGAKQHHKM